MFTNQKLRLLTTTIFPLILAVMVAAALACDSAEPTATPRPAGPVPTTPPFATATTVAQATATPARMPVSPEVQPTRGGVLRYPRSISVDAPDPAYSILHATRHVLPAIYASIVKAQPDGTLAADLAESWDISDDGETITFSLRENVQFQDGTDVNAQAVKWNYDRSFDQEVGSPRKQELSPPLERVEIVDDMTVRFVLSQPFRPLMPVLSIQAGMIASPTAVQKYDSYSDRLGEFGRRPIGAGPFRLDDWNLETGFRFSRYENYWDEGLPYVSGLQMPLIPDNQIIFAMLRTGEVDVMEGLSAQDIPLAERNPDLRVVAREGLNTAFTGFRTDISPWDNKALRQAFAWAIDRNAEIQSVFAGRGVPAQSMIGPGFGQWHDSSVQVYEYNVQRAQEKLVEAGYPDGFTFTAKCRVSGLDSQTCEVIQASLAEAGITMNIEPYENVVYFADWTARNHDGPLTTWWGSRPDPGILLRLIYHSNGSQNTWGYSNPEVDRLIEQADGIYDVSQAKALYSQVQRMVADDVPIIPIAWWNNFYGVRANVMNFQTYLDGVVRFTDVWLAQ